MAEIVKCDICGVVPELRVSRSSRMISHRCKDFHSGWHNRTKVVEDWNNSNSQKIEEAASSTSTNKAHDAISRLGTLYLSTHETNRHVIAAVNHFAKWADKQQC